MVTETDGRNRSNNCFSAALRACVDHYHTDLRSGHYKVANKIDPNIAILTPRLSIEIAIKSIAKLYI